MAAATAVRQWRRCARSDNTARRDPAFLGKGRSLDHSVNGSSPGKFLCLGSRPELRSVVELRYPRGTCGYELAEINDPFQGKHSDLRRFTDGLLSMRGGAGYGGSGMGCIHGLPVMASRRAAITLMPCLAAVDRSPRIAYRCRVACSERSRPEIF